VHADLGGEQQFVERRVVVLADLLRIGDVEPQGIDERRLVVPVEILRQIAIRHEVEHADLHGVSSCRTVCRAVFCKCYAGATARSSRKPPRSCTCGEYLQRVFVKGEQRSDRDDLVIIPL
jgi:hypothetical protein